MQDKMTRVFEKQKGFKFKAKNTSAQERIAKLEMAKKAILANQSKIEEALQEDFGKSPSETLLTEIMPVITMINLTVKRLKKWMKPKRVKNSLLFFGTRSWISPEAKGNVLVISPWNYPFQLNLYPILTALSAGNTVIVKPSEFTPATNRVMRELMAGVYTEEELAFFEGEAQTTQDLLELPFDHIFFTGSTPVGKIIMQGAAKHLATCALELGGKSPAIIARDYDMKEAVERIAWGKLVNSGQTCVAPDYLLLDKTQLPEFLIQFKYQMQKLYGNNYQFNDDYCRIITPRHAKRLKDLVDQAVAQGAKVEYGGHLLENNKFEPTILTGVTTNMSIMQEEIFGPVLPVITAESNSEMVQLINQMDNPLSTYLFTHNPEIQEFFRQNTNSGGLGINETLLHVGHADLPFGGAGKSGHGRYHGEEGFKEFSNQRAVLKRNIDTKMSYFYPPYNKKMKSLLDQIIQKFNQFL